MAEHSVRVVRVGNPDAFGLAGIQELVRDGLKPDDFPDAEWVMKWALEKVTRPDVFIAVAIAESDFIGIAIAEYMEGPWNPHPFVLFVYSRGNGAFDAMMVELRSWSMQISGTREFRFVNGSGNSDESYFRRLKKVAEGRTMGSIMSCRWKLPGAIDEEDESCLYSGSQPRSHSEAEAPAQSLKTSRRKNTKRSADSSRIPMWTRFKAAARRLRGRSPSQ